jgi:hypothetical protein
MFCLAWSVFMLIPLFARAQSPLSLDEKLAAIRQGLVQAALEGPTKVQSTVWIDANGALQESSSFRTGMQVRGVKILSYGRDNRDQPTADMRWQSETVVKTAQASPKIATTCAAFDHENGLKHLIGFDIDPGEDWGVDDMSALRVSTGLLAQQWTRKAAGNVLWKQRLSAVAGRSAYEKALLGSSADAMPWRVNLTMRQLSKQTSFISSAVINSVGRSVTSILPVEPKIQLHFSLTALNQQTPTFEASADLDWGVEMQNWSAPVPTMQSQRLLMEQVKNWSSEVQKLLACEPVIPEVILTSSDSLRINAGSLVGLRVGDELLLANGKNFIKKILEPGMISESVTAKVLMVRENHAQLQVSAGVKQAVQLGWRAWPTELSH